MAELTRLAKLAVSSVLDPDEVRRSVTCGWGTYSKTAEVDTTGSSLWFVSESSEPRGCCWARINDQCAEGASGGETPWSQIIREPLKSSPRGKGAATGARRAEVAGQWRPSSSS